MKRGIIAVVLLFSMVGLAVADAGVDACPALVGGGSSACVSYGGPSFRFIGPGIYISEEGSYFVPGPQSVGSGNAPKFYRKAKKRSATKKCICKAK